MAGDIYVSFGADTGGLEAAFSLAKSEANAFQREMRSVSAEIVRTGAATDSELIQKLNKLGAEAAAAKAHMAELSGELREHKRSAEESGGAIEGLRNGLESMVALQGVFSGFAELAAAAIAFEKIKEMVSEAAEAGEKIERMDAKLGATAGQVQQIGAIAQLTGTDFDTMALAVERMQLQLVKSESQGSRAGAALKALGIDAKEFRSAMIPEQIDQLADAFSRFADGPTKTAAAMALLGRSGAEMIPYLDRGREGLEELNKTARETGIILSDQDVKALAEVKEQTNVLNEAVTALERKLVVAFAPAILKIVETLTAMVEKLGAAAAATTRFFDTINAGLAKLSPGGNDYLLAAAAAIPNTVGVPGAGGGDVTVHAKKPQVPEMAMGGGRSKKKTSEADLSEYEEEQKAVEDLYTQTQKAYADDLAHHRVSIQAWLAESKGAYASEIEAVKLLYAKELTAANLTSDQIKAIKIKEADTLRKIDDKIADDVRKAADEEQKQWQGALSTVTGAINSQLRAIISGSETWKGAMVKIFEDFAFKAIEALEKLALEEIAVKLVGAGIGFPLPGFAAGAWDLPGDTMAMVHKGEMIVPAAPASALRGMFDGGASQGNDSAGGAGDTHVHFHVSAIDGASTKKFFHENGAHIASSLRTAVRNGQYFSGTGRA